MWITSLRTQSYTPDCPNVFFTIQLDTLATCLPFTTLISVCILPPLLKIVPKYFNSSNPSIISPSRHINYPFFSGITLLLFELRHFLVSFTCSQKRLLYLCLQAYLLLALKSIYLCKIIASFHIDTHPQITIYLLLITISFLNFNLM